MITFDDFAHRNMSANVARIYGLRTHPVLVIGVHANDHRYLIQEDKLILQNP